MKEATVFIADDGTQFSTMHDCEMYEQALVAEQELDEYLKAMIAAGVNEPTAKSRRSGAAHYRAWARDGSISIPKERAKPVEPAKDAA